jgi:hypothetical protein
MEPMADSDLHLPSTPPARCAGAAPRDRRRRLERRFPRGADFVPMGGALLVALTSALASTAAQTRPAVTASRGTGVAGSGMAQGTASITTRSDVTLSLDSDRGTSGTKLQAIGHAVGRKMSDIRACYAQATANDPTVTGQLHLRIAVDAGAAAPSLEVRTDTLNEDALRQCVLRALRAVDLSSVERPAAALVSLEFANTAARGARAVQQARTEQTASVTIDPTGRANASGGTGEREVGYAVSADDDATAPEVVAAVHRALGDGLAGLLDCRRRAGRRASPAGAITLTAEVGSSLRRTATVSSTVADPGAPRCVERALESLALPSGHAGGRVRVTVTFGPEETEAAGPSAGPPTPVPGARRRTSTRPARTAAGRLGTARSGTAAVRPPSAARATTSAQTRAR